ncbi:MAG: cupredoxin domain-containing protein [Acidobacteria bacterium]|nr:cupredoxin domain-containing protein [Acidobacteriota bacterium]
MRRAILFFVALMVAVAAAQDAGPVVAKPFSVTARRYAFDPPRIEVNQDDLVKIELHTEDIAHSMTIDAYRIAKRASPGQPVTFEFRADRPGTFPYYCNLQIEDGCRQMRGELVVRPRR